MRTIMTAALCALCLVALTFAAEARAQIANPRPTGQIQPGPGQMGQMGLPLSTQVQPGLRQMGQALSAQSPSGSSQSLEDVGTLQGTERYLRRNRRPEDFVGSDSREARRYVGALQSRARGIVPLTTQGLTRRIDRSEALNQPLAPPKPGMPYYPRLELSFGSAQMSGSDLPAHQALDTLARSPYLSDSSHIEVLMAGRTAILRGAVLSATEREIAEMLLSFEPGISEIRNELQVDPALREGRGSLAEVRRQVSPQQKWTTLNPVTQSPMRTQTGTSPTARSF